MPLLTAPRALRMICGQVSASSCSMMPDVPVCWIEFCSMSRFTSSGASFRSEEHTSELQSLMRISYAVFCLKKKKKHKKNKSNIKRKEKKDNDYKRKNRVHNYKR